MIEKETIKRKCKACGKYNEYKVTTFKITTIKELKDMIMALQSALSVVYMELDRDE